MSNLVIAFDVPCVLMSLVLISGGVALFDILFLAKKRAPEKKEPIVIE